MDTLEFLLEEEIEKECLSIDLDSNGINVIHRRDQLCWPCYDFTSSPALPFFSNFEDDVLFPTTTTTTNICDQLADFNHHYHHHHQFNQIIESNQTCKNEQIIEEEEEEELENSRSLSLSPLSYSSPSPSVSSSPSSSPSFQVYQTKEFEDKSEKTNEKKRKRNEKVEKRKLKQIKIEKIEKIEKVEEVNEKEESEKKEQGNVCHICRRTMKRPEHLKRHLLIHSRIKMHKCPFPSCGKEFARVDNMKQHEKRHFKVKTFTFKQYSPSSAI